MPRAPARGAAVFIGPAAPDEEEEPEPEPEPEPELLALALPPLVALALSEEALELAEETTPLMLLEILERAALADEAAEPAAAEAELAALDRAVEPEAATAEAELAAPEVAPVAVALAEEQ